MDRAVLPLTILPDNQPTGGAGTEERFIAHQTKAHMRANGGTYVRCAGRLKKEVRLEKRLVARHFMTCAEKSESTKKAEERSFKGSKKTVSFKEHEGHGDLVENQGFFGQRSFSRRPGESRERE